MRQPAKFEIDFQASQDTTVKTELRGFSKPSFSFHSPRLVFLERKIPFALVKSPAHVDLPISEMSQRPVFFVTIARTVHNSSKNVQKKQV